MTVNRKKTSRRVKYAGVAVKAYADQKGVDQDEAFTDLLADLMHWCDHKGIDFQDEYERANNHYVEETKGHDDYD
jgi:hypothetical protein